MNIFRWIILLPVAVISMILISSGASLNFENITVEDNLIGYYFLNIVIGIGGSIAFIYTGFKVAPSHKKLSLIWLCVIQVIYQAITFYYLWDAGVAVFLRIGFSLMSIYLTYYFLTPQDESTVDL